MLWTIAQKEFLGNLLNFRFIAGLVLCFLLATLSAWIVTQDYAERVADYSEVAQKHQQQLADVKVYSEVQVTFDRRPEPLGLFCEGVEKQLGNSVTVSHGDVPDVRANASGNPLLAGFPSLDLALIVQVIFSLLALLFTYDAVSGEKERGTLSLMLANAVPRYQVLLGKYLGILLSLLVPIVAAMLVAVGMVALSPAMDLGGADWERLALIALLSLLYVSVFCNLGFWVSTMAYRSTTSAMCLLFFWVAFVLILPKGMSTLATYLRPVSSADGVQAQTRALWDEFNARVADFNEEHPAMGTSSWDNNGRKVFMGEGRKMKAYRERNRFAEPLRIEYADKVGSIREQSTRELERQALLATTLARLSPVAVYQNAASALAKTDAGTYLEFMRHVKQYRRELIDYLRSERAFDSFLFFTRQKEAEMFDDDEFRQWARGYWDRWEKQFKAGEKLSEVDPWNSVEPLELSDLPQFRWSGPNIVASLGRALPDVAILVLLNVLFFLMAHLAFLRGAVG